MFWSIEEVTMANIGIFLPRQNMLECAERVVREEERRIRVMRAVRDEEAAEAAAEVAADGVQVLVAQGFQSKAVKEREILPVVELPFSTADLGLAVRKIRERLGTERPVIAFVGAESLFPHREGLEELFGFRLRLYGASGSEEVPKLIRKAAFEGADGLALDVGDEQDELRIQAAEETFPGAWVQIETGTDSIRAALDGAERLGESLERERNNSARLTAILDLSFNGVIRLNNRREIVAVNRVIETVLGKKAAEVVGTPVEKVMQGIDRDSIEEILNGGQELFAGSVNVNGAVLLVAGAPLWLGNEINGAVLICRRVRAEDGAEKRRREDRENSGYVAVGNFDQIARTGPAMRRCMQTARLYACSRSPILLRGETGTEVELFAEAIHNNSVQKNGPFVTVNCGAVPEEEQAAVLFGKYDLRHKEWETEGAMGAASCGTVFLQEVERLSPGNQFLLLAAISRQMYWNRESMVRRNLSVRVIVSSQEELEPLVSRGQFRRDLYHLLRAMELRIPPLREEREEISRLARAYVGGYLERYSKYMEVDEAAYLALEEFPWEGNLLQLDRFCERLVLGSRRRRIDESFMRTLMEELYPEPETEGNERKPALWRDPEAETIARALEECAGNRARAAQSLGISVTTLWRRMKKYGISEKYGV